MRVGTDPPRGTAMGLIKVFDNLMGRMFGGDAGGGDGVKLDPALVAAVCDEIVATVEPRIKLVRDWRERLEPGIRKAVVVLRGFVQEFPPPVELTREGWAADPQMRAFFASADDVEHVLSLSKELRNFFDAPANAAADGAYVLLGMSVQQKKVLASVTEGGQLRRDVERTTVSFGHHVLLAPAVDGPSLRVEVGRRVLVTLARVALGHIGAMLANAKDLDQRKAYLRVRLKYLRAGARSAEGMVSDQAHESEIAQAQAELNATVSALQASKRKLVTMNDYIDQVRAVLDHADEHIQLKAHTLRLTSMNFLATEGDGEAAREVKVVDVAVGGELRGCVVIGHLPRSAMPRHVSMLDRAAKELV
jgi:hypothetical protein